MSHGDPKRCATIRAMAAGQLHRLGVPVVEESAPEPIRRQQERAAEEGEKYVDPMIDLCRRCVRYDGNTVARNDEATIRSAVSGASLADVFTTTVNTVLNQGFDEEPDTTQGWTNSTEVKNFSEITSVTLNAPPSLDPLPRGGTAEHADPSATGETYAITRFAKSFSIDEMDILDDNINALLEMPRQLGRAAARLRPDLVYSILLANAALDADSTALFHSDHDNLGEAGSALAAATLGTGVAAIAAQRQGDIPLNLKAGYLLVPEDLRVAAAGFLHALMLGDPGQDIILRSDSRLGATGVVNPLTGEIITGSATNWFLSNSAADPTIEIASIKGRNGRPEIRGYSLEGGQFGIGWDIAFDIGAKALRHETMYKATGAS